MATDSALEDVEVIEKVREGDVDAFATIIQRYQAYVLSIVASRIPQQSVKEVGHEVFVSAFQSLHSYRGDAPLRFWLRSITTRCCYDFWNQKHKAHEISETSLTTKHDDTIETFLSGRSKEIFQSQESQLAAREILELLLARMRPEDKAVLMLVDLEGYRVKEAAKELGWSVTNTKVRAFRARKKFRELAKKLLQQEGFD